MRKLKTISFDKKSLIIKYHYQVYFHGILGKSSRLRQYRSWNINCRARNHTSGWLTKGTQTCKHLVAVGKVSRRYKTSRSCSKIIYWHFPLIKLWSRFLGYCKGLCSSHTSQGAKRSLPQGSRLLSVGNEKYNQLPASFVNAHLAPTTTNHICNLQPALLKTFATPLWKICHHIPHCTERFFVDLWIIK